MKKCILPRRNIFQKKIFLRKKIKLFKKNEKVEILKNFEFFFSTMKKYFSSRFFFNDLDYVSRVLENWFGKVWGAAQPALNFFDVATNSFIYFPNFEHPTRLYWPSFMDPLYTKDVPTRPYFLRVKLLNLRVEFRKI